MYLTYGQTAVPVYQKIISGVFSSFTTFIVSLIGFGQILVGFFLLKKKRWFLLGILGGIVFMAFSLILLYSRYKKIQTSD
jgi:hypothetical protein